MLIPAKIFIVCVLPLTPTYSIHHSKFIIPIEYVVPEAKTEWTYPKINNQVITTEDFIKDHEEYLYRPY
jgi:hypothetical protein